MNPELSNQSPIESKEKEPAQRILRGMPEYYNVKEKREEHDKDREPRYAMLNLPSRCVLQCEKCARATERDKLEQEKMPVLTLDEQKKFLDFAHQIGARELVIVGEGEPTQKNNWQRLYEPIISETFRKGMGTVLFTTAFFLTREQAEFCKNHNVTLIVSLDSLDNATYRKLYGIDKWGKGNVYERMATSVTEPADHVKKKVALLQEIYDGSEETLQDGRTITRLGLNTTITLRNEHELDALRQFAHEHKMFYVANYLMPEGRAGRYENFEELVGTDENWERHRRLAEEKSDSSGMSSIEGGVCSYFADGIACDSRGNILTCGYASATAHASENFRDVQSSEELLWIYERNRRAYKLWCEEMNRPEEGDKPSCPLRDKDYEHFIEWLNKERLGSIFVGTEDKGEREAIVKRWLENKN